MTPNTLIHNVNGKDMVVGSGATLTVKSGATLALESGSTFTQNLAGAAQTITVKANTAAAYSLTDGTTSVVSVDTQNTVKNVHTLTLTGVPVTVATEAAVHQNSTLNIAAKTITYTGTATTTSSLGAQLYLGIPTFTDASAGTVTTGSTLHVSAVAAAGGSLTLTNRRMISTGVSDCYLTNAGVWTDTACWRYGKKKLSKARRRAIAAIDSVLDKITPQTWQYRKSFTVTGDDGAKTRMSMDDRDRNRVGILYDELPDELRAPGEDRAVSPGVMASFALAALRVLRDDNRRLSNRLAKLEAAAG